MEAISLSAAAQLTDRSERTLWRWMETGQLLRIPDQLANKTMVSLSSVLPYLIVELNDDDMNIVTESDAGNAESQNDLGLLLLEKNRADKAIFWFEQSASREHPDAMHWLGRCYLGGDGVPLDENIGLMWIAKAAAHGHIISEAQIKAMRDKFIG